MSNSILFPVDSEIVIRKSRFIGHVQAVADRAQAQAIVDELRRQHPTARHVCWALLAGGHSAAFDDGEPSGTAGRPMLEILRHHDLQGVLATAVRYFGGVKLGAGGLIRAYAECISVALGKATIVPNVPSVTLRCAVDYSLEGMLRHEIDQAGASLQDVSHAEDVRLVFSLGEDVAQDLIGRLNELSNGQIEWLK